MIRLFDFGFSLLGFVLLLPFLVTLYLIGLFDTGSPLFRQKRLGKDLKIFTLVKFRTMKLDTRSVSTHLVNKSSITKFGGFLRKTKLDELPQLINVVLGDMSLVGPRPNLPNQAELISFRQSMGVYKVRPGITGLSQINEIDMSSPELLAKTDREMISTLTIQKYFIYIFATISGKGSGDRIK